VTELIAQASRAQRPLPDAPYDCWVSSEGDIKAEFRRVESGYLVRFPDEADFLIELPARRITGWPTRDCREDHFRSLYTNAILPIPGNHQGGLFLHGSAVSINGRAVAFLGQSRSGKTTLAGAFAKAGHPFLTEDVIDLARSAGEYQVQPKPSGLRLFSDSAAFLLGDVADWADEDEKRSVSGGSALPFCDHATPIAALFVLGDDPTADFAIERLAPPSAVSQLMPHAFVLDVEDKARLRDHFGRIVALSLDVACYSLDYLRDYSQLPRVMAAIAAILDGD
jgi:hypothetical protein